MSERSFYPLRFEPIYQYRLWGGRHLSQLLSAPLPDIGPIGEAWLLSDRDDHQSQVADGPFKGSTIGQLLEQFPQQMLGKFAGRFARFPLLLKFLDVHEMLSVQVHPSDQHAELLPPGESGKTEAWIVLESGQESRIYAGLKTGTTKENLRWAIRNGEVEDHLAGFTPKPGDGILIPAGTVHSLGGDVVVFEIQQNSDVTFRLYDWNHIDPQTGQARQLQVYEALDCIDFGKGAVRPVVPIPESVSPVLREHLFLCKYFSLWRIRGESQFTVGELESPRVQVCLAGEGELVHQGSHYTFTKGDVLLLPAIVGACSCHPAGPITLLEISIPEGG
ncbi:MAG TPA: type I phosphomannose isomerase catalytic subunit [Prolixibacteraceae bacterium]|jgi:mannose-6-phosphate isomerase